MGFRRPDGQVMDWVKRCDANSGRASSRACAGLDRVMQLARGNAFVDELDYVLPLVGKDLTAARVPLRNQIGDDIAANTSFVSGDYDEADGLDGGSGKYLTPGIVPNSDMSRDDSHGAAYTDKSSGAPTVIYGVQNFNSRVMYLYPRWSDGNTYTDHFTRTNSYGRTQHYDSMSGGFYLAVRDGISSHDLYKGSGVTSFAVAASANNGSPGSLPTSEMVVMAGREAGTVANHFLDKGQWFSFGKSFTSTQATDYFNAVQWFQEFLGRES